MNLLEQIATLGISVDQLQDLSPTDLIRIEKKLKAEVRMNPDIDTGSIDEILKALKQNKQELQLLFQPQYEVLRAILQSNGNFVLMKKPDLEETAGDEKLGEFIALNFHAELKQYMNHCLVEDHYRALFLLVEFNKVLGSTIKDELVQKLTQKLQYLTEVIRLKSEGMYTKMDAALNPYFYRCLNPLGTIQFDRGVTSLLNLTIDNVERHRINMRILFAMGQYNSSNTDLDNTISKNWAIASSNGAREKTSFDGNSGKGGTHFMSKSPKTTVQKQKSSESSFFKGLGVVGFIIFILFKIIVISSRHAPEPEFKTDYGIDELRDRLSNSLEDNFIAANNKDTDADFHEKMLFLHSDSCKIISTGPAPFDLAESYFVSNPGVSNASKDHLELVNKTKLELVVHIRGEKKEKNRFVFLKPRESKKMLFNGEGVRIYTGGDPQIITYETENGNPKDQFIFGKFGENERLILNQYHQISETALLYGISEAQDTQENVKVTIETNFIGLKLTVER